METAADAGRTAHDLETWREGLLTQVAVAWVLGCVFVRFCQIRSMLGLTSDGEHRLTQAINTGEYEIGEDVGCDWTRADALIGEAKNRPADEQLELLKAALDLAGGQVGADAPARQFSWLVNDHSVYGLIESRLLDAADRLGELALEAEQPGLAKQSSDIGLKLVPGSEAMFRLQMRAASAAGDRRGLKSAYQAAQSAACADGPWVEVEEETEMLWVALSGSAEQIAS